MIFFYQGQKVFDALVAAGQRGIKISIVQNSPSRAFPQEDSMELATRKLAEVQSINFPSLFGSGVLHTKFWIVDEKHVYIGSANMDWRSLTEVICRCFIILLILGQRIGSCTSKLFVYGN